MQSGGSGPPSLHPKPPRGACGEGGRQVHQSLGSEGLSLSLTPLHTKYLSWRAWLHNSFSIWSVDVYPVPHVRVQSLPPLSFLKGGHALPQLP